MVILDTFTMQEVKLQAERITDPFRSGVDNTFWKFLHLKIEAREKTDMLQIEEPEVENTGPLIITQ